ncbi:hypothetical protein FVE85_6207 [Porphyridium purpureum]|uniref:Uncharacterized protein n=1 Tax=Porphyridium purpureum TaxID=35688 RepID=A0A5J4Z699_PORPP|nr:hypothetical protein FVE85_6207 [Porphyridium purpureum]|eukprot:POR7732..scf295_1
MLVRRARSSDLTGYKLILAQLQMPTYVGAYGRAKLGPEPVHVTVDTVSDSLVRGSGLPVEGRKVANEPMAAWLRCALLFKSFSAFWGERAFFNSRIFECPRDVCARIPFRLADTLCQYPLSSTAARAASTVQVKQRLDSC